MATWTNRSGKETITSSANQTLELQQIKKWLLGLEKIWVHFTPPFFELEAKNMVCTMNHFCHKLLLYAIMYCRYKSCNGNLDRSALTLISTYGFGELLVCGGGVQLLTSIQGIEKYWYRSFWFLATSTEDNPGFIQSLNMLGPGNLWGNYQRVKILFYIQYPSWKCCQNRSLPYCMKDKLIKIVLDWYETSPKHVHFQDSEKRW